MTEHLLFDPLAAVEHFYLDDYLESRALFIEHASARSAAISHYPLQVKGKSGEDLAITVAKIGAQTPGKVLVLISSTHGLEGPAGGAIQAQFLAESLPDIQVPEDTAILLVHAANPFGWSLGRRQNEDNVDLNRNFRVFGKRHSASEDYAQLDPLINPQEMSDTVMRNLMQQAQVLIAEHGMPWLQRVISEGQYQFPKGLNYGGRAPTETNLLLTDVVSRHLAGCRDGLIIDIHTGLGASGEAAVLSGELLGSANHEWLQKAYAGFDVKALYGNSASELPATKGKLARALSRYAMGPNMRSLTLEFGTYEPMRVFQAGLRENWLHHYGDRTSAIGVDIVNEAREVYNPVDPAWRSAVLAGGRAIIEAGWQALVHSQVE